MTEHVSKRGSCSSLPSACPTMRFTTLTTVSNATKCNRGSAVGPPMHSSICSNVNCYIYIYIRATITFPFQRAKHTSGLLLPEYRRVLDPCEIIVPLTILTNGWEGTFKEGFVVFCLTAASVCLSKQSEEHRWRATAVAAALSCYITLAHRWIVTFKWGGWRDESQRGGQEREVERERERERNRKSELCQNQNVARRMWILSLCVPRSTSDDLSRAILHSQRAPG